MVIKKTQKLSSLNIFLFVEKLLKKQEASSKKILFSNFFSLSSLQIASYILPLVTFPYLVRVLGDSNFGLIAFSQGIMQYFVVIADYGFAMTAPRDIAVLRGEKDKISETFFSILYSKIVLMCFSLCILLIVVFSLPRLRNDWLIFVLMFGMVLDNVFSPIWFFQGIQEMKYIAIRSIVVKVLFTILIFVLVKSPQDYVLVPAINLVGYVIAAIFSFSLIFKRHGIRFVQPKILLIKQTLKDGLHVFIARLAVPLSTSANVIVLGFVYNNSVVGQYSAVERIVLTFGWLAIPAFQAFYPYVAEVAHVSKIKALDLIKKFLVIITALYLIAFLVVNLFAKELILLILGKQFLQSKILFRILSLNLIFAPVAYVLSNILFLVCQLDKFLPKIFLFSGILNIGLLFILIYILRLKSLAAGAVFIFIEIFVIFLLLFTFYRKKKDLIYVKAN